VSIKTNLREGSTGQRTISDQLGDITLWDDFGDARFRALIASSTYDTHKTRINVAYTLGWAKSEFGDLTTSDYPNASYYNLQRSEGDERHRVVLSGLKSLPFGMDLSAIGIAASPRPFLVTTGVDDNGNGTEIDDWPDGVRTKLRSGWKHWYRTVDARLAKSFAMRTGQLVVTAEAFNLFSWSNHAQYQTKENLGAYGQPTGDYARRQGQLGLRYQF
jgi:hypothetical protein